MHHKTPCAGERLGRLVPRPAPVPPTSSTTSATSAACRIANVIAFALSGTSDRVGASEPSRTSNAAKTVPPLTRRIGQQFVAATDDRNPGFLNGDTFNPAGVQHRQARGTKPLASPAKHEAGVHVFARLAHALTGREQFGNLRKWSLQFCRVREHGVGSRGKRPTAFDPLRVGGEWNGAVRSASLRVGSCKCPAIPRCHVLRWHGSSRREGFGQHAVNGDRDPQLRYRIDLGRSASNSSRADLRVRQAWSRSHVVTRCRAERLP